MVVAGRPRRQASRYSRTAAPADARRKLALIVPTGTYDDWTVRGGSVGQMQWLRDGAVVTDVGEALMRDELLPDGLGLFRRPSPGFPLVDGTYSRMVSGQSPSVRGPSLPAYIQDPGLATPEVEEYIRFPGPTALPVQTTTWETSSSVLAHSTPGPDCVHIGDLR